MTDKSISHDSRAIANEILKIANSKGISLTIMQLIKLVFFAHGWTLAFLNKPLAKEDAEAWQYGPVFPDVYYAFPNSGSAQITSKAKDIYGFGLDFVENFDEQETKILESVVEGYGRMHAFSLSNLTHEVGSPWHKTMQEKGVYSVIPNDEIKSYFLGLKSKNAG